MAKYFYYAVDGRRLGPVDYEQVQKLVTARQIFPSTQLMGETTNQIVLAETVPGLVWPQKEEAEQEPAYEPVVHTSRKAERGGPYWGDVVVGLLQAGFAWAGFLGLIASAKDINQSLLSGWMSMPGNAISSTLFQYAILALETLAAFFTLTGKRWALWSTFVFFCVKLYFLIVVKHVPPQTYAWEVPVPVYCLVRLYLTHFGI